MAESENYNQGLKKGKNIFFKPSENQNHSISRFQSCRTLFVLCHFQVLVLVITRLVKLSSFLFFTVGVSSIMVFQTGCPSPPFSSCSTSSKFTKYQRQLSSANESSIEQRPFQTFRYGADNLHGMFSIVYNLQLLYLYSFCCWKLNE